MALSVLIWSTASHYPAGIFTLFFYTIEIYRIVSFWYNCVLWTVQINWKHRVNKTKKKTNNNTICFGQHHKKTNTNNENKIIVCPFFYSPFRVYPPLVKCQNLMFSGFIDTLMYGFSSTGVTIYCYFGLKFNNTCCEVIFKRRYNDNDIMTANKLPLYSPYKISINLLD
jgi:hypothetical protein